MSRFLASVAAALALTLVAAACAPDRSSARVTVGIGDQNSSMFRDPLYQDLHLRTSRVIVSWDVALHSSYRRFLDSWLKDAEDAGIEPLVTFGASPGSRCPAHPCRLPTVRQFTRAFSAFRSRYPDIDTISAWNEANHRAQPTFKNPKRAALYFNVIRSRCPGCKIVAADVLDDPNMVSWLKTFRRHARAPRIWGLHNYRDTNPRPGQLLGGTRRLLRAVKGKVWLTETGGLVKFVLPGGSTLFPFSESRADRALRRMFSLARRYRSRVQRLYIYNWQAPISSNRFDAGLIRRDGTPRAGYNTVKRYLRTSPFGP